MEDEVAKLIAELEEISPMPDDDDLTYEMVEQYSQIVLKLDNIQDPRIIKPLIYSFGYNDCYGVYQTVRSILEDFQFDLLFPILIEATKSEEHGIRFWATHILGRYGQSVIIPEIAPLVNDPDELVQIQAIRALERTYDPLIRDILKPLENDPSPKIRKEVKEALNSL